MKYFRSITAAIAFVAASAALALGIPQIEYLTKSDFLALAFQQQPKWSMLRLKGQLKQEVESILTHPYTSKRLRYWLDGQRSAWVIDEIGKDMPITIGVVINAGKIERIEILVYREERGGEVHEDFFTRQFHGLTLQNKQLSGQIDGITGATMSVDAVTRVATMALHLDQYVQNK